MKSFPNAGSYIGSDAIFENVFEKFKQNWQTWIATIERCTQVYRQFKY
jgi:uncharacterized protein